MTLFIFIVCFWVASCIGFVVLMVAHRFSVFLPDRMGRYALAVLASATSVAMIWKLSENEIVLGLQIFVAFGIAVLGGVSLTEAFETERLWRNRKERKAAERQ